jgi:hypothetical protein
VSDTWGSRVLDFLCIGLVLTPVCWVAMSVAAWTGVWTGWTSSQGYVRVSACERDWHYLWLVNRCDARINQSSEETFTAYLSGISVPYGRHADLRHLMSNTAHVGVLKADLRCMRAGRRDSGDHGRCYLVPSSHPNPPGGLWVLSWFIVALTASGLGIWLSYTLKRRLL